MVSGEVSSCPTGKSQFIHCWDAIEGRNAMIPKIFTGLTVTYPEGSCPIAMKKRVLQVECTYTLPVDSPIDLPAVHLLSKTCGLTTGDKLRIRGVILHLGLVAHILSSAQLLKVCVCVGGEVSTADSRLSPYLWRGVLLRAYWWPFPLW